VVSYPKTYCATENHMTRRKGSTRPAWAFLGRLYAEFTKDYGPMVSASMSFYALLSIVPLLIMAVAGMAYVLHFLHSTDDAYSKVFDYVNQFAPSLAGGAGGLLQSVVKGRGIAGGFAFLALVWSGTQFFVSLEMAVNIAWSVKRRRSFLRQRLVALAMVFGAGLLLLINLGVTTLVAIIRGWHYVPFLNRVLHSTWIWSVAGSLFTLTLTMITFTCVYRFLPNRRVKWLDALVGGTVAGALWEIAKHFFSWYVSTFGRYNAIYGSLGSVIVLMLWIYYSSIVTVIGAEVAALHANVTEQN
jgi:membrane protein